MRVNCNISTIPQSINDSYPGYGYYRLGLMQFTYVGFRGPVHWINCEQQCFEPEYACPDGFDYCFFPGVIGQMTIVPMDKSDMPDMLVNNIATNLATGKGMPMKLSQ